MCDSQQATELAEREGMLKEQMNSYGEKFKELQETLTKSNEVFVGFKKDSEKMQKRIKSSEKERLTAEKLAQKQSKEIGELTEKHEALKKESAALKKQKERMEMLCRTLTQERADLKEKLKGMGALPDSSSSSQPSADKTPGPEQDGAEATAVDSAAASTAAALTAAAAVES